jgi:hypothetical protein
MSTNKPLMSVDNPLYHYFENNDNNNMNNNMNNDNGNHTVTKISLKISEFYFGLNRCNPRSPQFVNLKTMLDQLLTSIKTHYIADEITLTHYISFNSILYKLIGYTRDILCGKGERTLSYMMIRKWYDHHPSHAFKALKSFVLLDDRHHPYGSWKDIKNIYKYCVFVEKDPPDHPLIKYMISLVNGQLKKDEAILKQISDIAPDDVGASSMPDYHYQFSLVSKWIPREKTKCGSLFEALAMDYYSKYLVSCKNQHSAIIKCKTHYRKLISSINKKIETVQIKQTANNWDEIKFRNVTAITLIKQKKAFLNINKKLVPTCDDSDKERDRMKCRENFISFINSSNHSGKSRKGLHIGVETFVKAARRILIENSFDLNKVKTNDEAVLLNSQWIDHFRKNVIIGNILPIVCTSVNNNTLHLLELMIGLGIRISEASSIKNRIMAFSSEPKWINLENCENFIEKVHCVLTSPICNTNMSGQFYKAIELIIDAIVNAKMTYEDVQNLILVVIPNPEFYEEMETFSLCKFIRTRFEYAGKLISGKPYDVPHLLFWNVHTCVNCNEFVENIGDQLNVSLVSGYEPNILNLLYEVDTNMLQKMNSYEFIKNMLEKEQGERYKYLNFMA